MKTLYLFAVIFSAIASLQAQVNRHNPLGIQKSEIKGNQIIVTDKDGAQVDFKIFGVAYSVDPAGQKFQDTFDRDLKLLKSLNANSIRTYRPLAAYDGKGNVDYDKTKYMLDRLAEEGITLAVGFDLNIDLLTGLYKTYLDRFGYHPALLAVLLGNEYNFHYIGDSQPWAEEWFTKEFWFEKLRDATQNIKSRSNRFVGVIHGELPSVAEIQEYKNSGVDLVLLNIYRGASFYTLFNEWKSNSGNSIPLVMAEFGRSSKNENGSDASQAQADWLRSLWGEIDNQMSINVAGGYVFELVDESWKGGANSLTGSEKDFGLFYANGDDKLSAKELRALWKGTSVGVENVSESKVMIFPNLIRKGQPFTVVSPVQETVIDIYNLSGGIVKRVRASGYSTQITLSVPTGFYLVKVDDFVTKLLVQ